MKRFLLLLAVFWSVGLSSAQAQDSLLVAYEGELIDGEARPLAGVFSFEFRLYSEADSGEALWSEWHHVAVIDGEYRIALGSATPLDPDYADREVFVAVVFQGAELVRERLMLQAIQEQPEDLVAQTEQADIDLENVTEVTFAQVADRALLADEAEHAADADRIAGRTIDEIDRSDEILERLGEHARDHDLHGGGGGSVGSSTTVLQRVGGAGGTRYTRMCPAGYVVVGIRGGSGTLIDSVELICAPLE